MTPKKRDKLIADVQQLLIESGYVENKYGHYVKVRPDGNVIRYKFTKIGIRKESQVIHWDNSKSWVRLRSGYIKDLYITEDRKLGGMTKK